MVTVQVTLPLVAQGAELVQVLGHVIIIGSVTVVNLGDAHCPGRSLIVYGTLETQMPVLIAAATRAKGRHTLSIGLATITGLLTVAAHWAQSHTIMSHGLFTSMIYTLWADLVWSH